MELYLYKAKVKRVVDADTMDIIVDVGFNMTTTRRFRIGDYTYDAPETFRPKSKKEKIHGEAATAKAKELLKDPNVVIKSHKPDVYNRWACDIILPDGRDFVTVMKELGFEKKDKY